MDGVIFDIQKFALHDGPGIRTAVFLKGCPLSCVWCCNPESQHIKQVFSYNPEKCSGCHRCIQLCPLDCLKTSGQKIEVDFERCTACGKCIEECTSNAIRIYGYSINSREIINDVLKDKDYFENSGGGLTLTGGEAMMQFDFSLELMKIAKQKGIHTVLETCGYAATDHFRKIMPYTDLFLFDYKHTGNEIHRKYTGVDQELILDNLDFLYVHNAGIIIRCPVIPGINDTEEHFRGIVNISLKYPALKGIEILGYHDFGIMKYASIGKKVCPIGSKTVNRETVKKWTEKLVSMGAKNMI